MANIDNPEKLIIGLYDKECIQFGDFTLKSGIKSPIYINLRGLCSIDKNSKLTKNQQLDIRQTVLDSYADQINSLGQADHILGIPEAALTLAGMVGAVTHRSVLQMRVKEKGYGQPAGIEGSYHTGETVTLLDDLITNGGAKIEAIEKIKSYGLAPIGIAVLIDREQGGTEELANREIRVESAIGIRTAISILGDHSRIDTATAHTLIDYFD